MDEAARAIVFDRDSGCVHCGKATNLQWAHVYTRRILSMRWDWDNSMVLCAGCHLWWHHEPAEAVAWWTAKYPLRAERLRLRRHTASRVDLKAIALSLGVKT
jgi:5-methylcytosine-specific restriction endonuclease McrA